MEIWMVFWLFINMDGAGLLSPVCYLTFDEAKLTAGVHGEASPMPEDGHCPSLDELLAEYSFSLRR
jgi:hypothetical protein